MLHRRDRRPRLSAIANKQIFVKQGYQKFEVLRTFASKSKREGSLKEKQGDFSTLLNFVFYCNYRACEHSFDSAAKIAVIFKGLLVDGTGS